MDGGMDGQKDRQIDKVSQKNGTLEVEITECIIHISIFLLTVKRRKKKIGVILRVLPLAT